MSRVPYDSYDYPKFWHRRGYEDQAEKIALGKFFSKIAPKDKIIDIGGGYGRLAEFYAIIFKNCFLVDPSEKLLNIARHALIKLKNIEFRRGTGEKLPVKDSSFDVALMVRVVHHLPRPGKALLEAYRALKPHGYLILEFANKINFQACLRAWLMADFNFTKNTQSLDLRSPQSIALKTIPFLSHHPQFIYKQLENSGFKIIESLSVSNFRHPFLKKILPLRLLLFLESIFQLPTSQFYFGPSIFLLCQK